MWIVGAEGEGGGVSSEENKHVHWGTSFYLVVHRWTTVRVNALVSFS